MSETIVLILTSLPMVLPSAFAVVLVIIIKGLKRDKKIKWGVVVYSLLVGIGGLASLLLGTFVIHDFALCFVYLFFAFPIINGVFFVINKKDLDLLRLVIFLTNMIYAIAGVCEIWSGEDVYFAKGAGISIAVFWAFEELASVESWGKWRESKKKKKETA